MGRAVSTCSMCRPHCSQANWLQPTFHLTLWNHYKLYRVNGASQHHMGTSWGGSMWQLWIFSADVSSSFVIPTFIQWSRSGLGFDLYTTHDPGSVDDSTKSSSCLIVYWHNCWPLSVYVSQRCCQLPLDSTRLCMLYTLLMFPLRILHVWIKVKHIGCFF